MNTRTGVDYEWFLGALGEATPVIEGGPVTLRHDVDHDLQVALRMARIEHRCGVRSTYYLLTPAWGATNYLGTWSAHGFMFSNEALAGIAELREMGHEVGYHNNLVTIGRQSGHDPIDLLAIIVHRFSDIGIAPLGTASHGDAEARAGGYVNYDFLKGRDLANLGLAYEAYFVPKVGYLSDSGGNLNGKPNPAQDDFQREIAALERPAQVLMHPWWWR